MYRSIDVSSRKDASLHCLECDCENLPGNRFCIGCGAALPAPACPRCDTSLPEGARFCSHCGHAVASTPPGVPAIGVLGERRQLSVMFCDIIGSTPLVNQLDPEEFSELLADFRDTCAHVVADFGGRIAQYLGDGILAYFGHPRAHEDDAARAVRAGLGIRDAFPALNSRLARRQPIIRERPLRIRIGIHTGPVVVPGLVAGEGAGQLAVGETVHVASRLEAIAEADCVVISEATSHLVQGVFVVEDLGSQRLKGIEAPVRAWRVLAPSGATSRLEIAGAAGLTPLVGREAERALILARWDRAKARQGQGLFLCGEPGIGKSRVVHALHEDVSDQAHTWIECQCSEYRQNSAFHPVAGFLEQEAGLRRDDPLDSQISGLERWLRRSDSPLEEVMPLLASVLSVPLPADYPAAQVGGEELRERTLRWLTSWIVAAARRQPAVMVIEDLHWCDPSTLDLLGRLLEQIDELPLLLVSTFRPEFESPLRGVEQLTLPPLTAPQAAAVVQFVSRRDALPEAWVNEMVARGDGVPLFIEELTRAVLESEEQREVGVEIPLIPRTLQDSLMARIDRLGPAKEALQLASVLGRSFSRKLLATVSRLSPAGLDSVEAELVRARLWHSSDSAGGPVYSFHHAMVRDTAYHSLLRSVRCRLHGEVAATLEADFPELVASQRDVIAWHCEEAGFAERAIAHYRVAAEEEAQRSANAEAVRHFRKALELLDGLNAGPERDRTELDLQVALAVPLIARVGYGDPQVERAYARADALCPRVADSPTRFRVLYGLSIYFQARADLRKAIEYGEQCLELAEKQDNAAERVLSHQRLGLSHFYNGKPAEALEHLRESIALYDPVRHRPLALVYGQDMGVVSRIYTGLALATTGPPGEARDQIRTAVADAREGGHPHTLAFALSFAGLVSQMLQEPDAVGAYSEEALALAEARGFPLWRGFGKVMHGWARAVSDEASDGVSELQAGLAELSAIGTVVGGPFFLSLLAEVQWRRGANERALETLGTALAFSRAHDSPYWEAELLRLEGEVRRARGEEARALALFELAVRTSQKQGAHILALRAATSAGRLLVAGGRLDAARSSVAPLLALFASGGASSDLDAARALLDVCG